MKSYRDQYLLGMLGQLWLGCESNGHTICSFDKYFLSSFYIWGSGLGIWDPSVKNKNKTKIPALVELQWEIQTKNKKTKKKERNPKDKNKLYSVLVGDKCYGNKKKE